MSKAQVTFIAVFLALLPNAFFGFDITDLGYHLYNQRMMIKKGFNYIHIIPHYFLTDYIAGVWAFIFKPFGLIGIYLGGIVAYSLCASVLVKLLEPFYSHLTSLFFTLIFNSLFIAFYSGPTLYLHYYTVPMLFQLLYIRGYVLFLKKPSFSDSILLGSAITLLFYMRFIALLLLPIVTCLWCDHHHCLTLILLTLGSVAGSLA